MLHIGAGDFDAEHLPQARSHFSLWAMVNAPLLIGFDLRKAPQALMEIWGNADIVSLNQDPLGNQAVLAYRSDDVTILVKTLKDGKQAVALLNRTAAPFDITLTAAQLKLAGDTPVALTDLWSKERLPVFTKEMKFKLAPHETRVFRVEGKRLLADGMYLSEMTGRINVAQDGISHPEPDPELYRASSYGNTSGNGEWPTYSGWGGAQADASPYSSALAIGTTGYDYGIGILANSRLEVKAAGQFARFQAQVGVDNATRDRAAHAQFFVYGDGKLLAKSRRMKFGDAPVDIDVDVQGVAVVELVVRRQKQAGDVAVTWGNARLSGVRAAAKD